MKGDTIINAGEETNYIISNEGNLIITQAALHHVGNYTCGAQNVANRKLSESAQLTVYGEYWTPNMEKIEKMILIQY